MIITLTMTDGKCMGPLLEMTVILQKEGDIQELVEDKEKMTSF